MKDRNRMDLQQLTCVYIDRRLVGEIPDQTMLRVQCLLISSDRPPNPLLQSSWEGSREQISTDQNEWA